MAQLEAWALQRRSCPPAARQLPASPYNLSEAERDQLLFWMLLRGEEGPASQPGLSSVQTSLISKKRVDGEPSINSPKRFRSPFASRQAR